MPTIRRRGRSSATAPTYNFIDDLTWNKGTHTITMGGNLRFVRNDRTSYANAFPTISFGRGILLGLGSDMVGRHAGLSGRSSPATRRIRLTDATNVTRAMRRPVRRDHRRHR